jgi:hypothetical protein
VEATLMHRGRNTLFLLVIGLALGAYVYFVEMKREPKPEAAEAARTKVFKDLDAAKIESVTVKASAGDSTTLKKTNDAWQIVAPAESAVDVSEVSSVTTNLASLESTRVVDEQPKDLAKFGLAEPRVDITFRAAGDKADRRLQLGSKTPTGGDLYAKLANEPKVFLVPSYLESSLDRTTFQLRDKTTLKFDRDKTDSLEVAAAGAPAMKFVKHGEAWTMTQPVAARTESSAVEGLVGRIASAQMKSLAAQAPDAGELGTYGLAKPAVQVTVGAGSATAGLLVGNESQDSGAYAKDASRPMVFTIEKALADDLKKGPADYRLKDLLEFRAFTGKKIEIARGGVTHAFEKKKVAPEKGPEKGTEKGADKDAGKDGKAAPAVTAVTDAVETWTQTQPAPAAGAKVDATKIDDLATKLADLRADSFVDKLPAGATTFATVSTQFDEDGKSEQVTIYQSGADYFATRANDTGALKLKAADVEAVTKALDAIK